MEEVAWFVITLVNLNGVYPLDIIIVPLDIIIVPLEDLGFGQLSYACSSGHIVPLEDLGFG